MTPTLADISFGEVVTMLSRVEDAIRRVQLPTANICYAGAVDQLASLVAHEQILADELESRRNKSTQPPIRIHDRSLPCERTGLPRSELEMGRSTDAGGGSAE